MEKPIIRLLTCGSVDDGKSTLIGRLLVETDSVPDDTVDAAKSVRSPVGWWTSGRRQTHLGPFVPTVACRFSEQVLFSRRVASPHQASNDGR